jgi:hypothetical protein
MDKKIDRALIIRRRKVDLSMEYADYCAASCERHNLPYEFIDGIEFMTSDDAFKAVGVWKQPEYVGTTGHNNCHASHIKTWRRIIEIDRPCLILEHDAVIKGDVKNIDIPDMAIITFGFRLGNESFYQPIGPITHLIEMESSTGTHACAMTSTTANWLVEEAETNGVGCNLDYWLMIERRSGLPLYVAEPPQAVCWPRYSTREWTEESKKRIEMGGTWSFQTNSTPGWRMGLKI